MDATKHSAFGCKRVYLGPSLSFIKNGQVFINEDAIPEVSDAVKKCILPIDKMVEFQKRLNDKESLETLYYQRISKGANNG